MLRTRAAWIVGCLLVWADRGADLQVCAGPPGPALCVTDSATSEYEEADVDVGRRTGVLPHLIGAAALLFFYPAPASAMTCASCHKTEALSQPSTSMGHALELVEDCGILREHPRLTFQYGRYSYTIARQGGRPGDDTRGCDGLFCVSLDGRGAWRYFPPGGSQSRSAVRELSRAGAASHGRDAGRRRQGRGDAASRRHDRRRNERLLRTLPSHLGGHCGARAAQHRQCALPALPIDQQQEIGRASCRERV